ncbi:MAG: glutamine-synthetase adenylyltransferase [Bryobacterales bacterium]|nr:glutamine-synthetase adenylyltransferase [Bryobacterales bacterium]MBV9399291.1 glutamine-synthetase adenylyltransferase [Bryobacterales bacterium]
MQQLLTLPYQDRPRAVREIANLSDRLPPAVSEHFDKLLAASPAPERALQSFMRLCEWQPAAFERLTSSIAGIRQLVAVFTQSRFLSEEILEHPEWAEQLLDQGKDSRILHQVLSADDFRAELEKSLPLGVPHPLELARFRRRQILRIVIRDVLGLGTLPEIAAELSELADAIVETAYERIHRHLIARYGTPRAEDGRQSHFAVIALGKLGGRELNYSSDIDLMFLYSDAGQTDGPESITNKEFFKRGANQLTALLSTYTAEGMCYRVDLRLRPDGSLGEVCISLDGARKYYETRARDWELQMLIKARVAAGHRATGRALLEFIEPRTYSSTLDFSAIEQLSLTRERLNEKLAQRQIKRGIQTKIRERGNAIDVKLERGGIRDIEFVVQCLQRLYGGSEPWVRHGGTLLALARLQDKGFLSGAEYGRLASAYQFLRHLEHRLQFEDDLQTHALPQDPGALELLARRMPGGSLQEHSAAQLMRDLHRHFEEVREIYERVVHARPAAADGAREIPAAPGNAARVSHAVMILEQRAPALSAELARAHLQRGFRPFEHFLDRLSGDPERLALLNNHPELAAHALDLFEHSPYFAEEFIRMPELLDEVAKAAIPLYGEEPAPCEMTELRRWFRREMVRIQTESVCKRHPIFDTLARTSELADATIARAYEIAVAETLETHPPQSSGYRPLNQMWVVALGRLGMRELDLASDADLVFVLSDSDASELTFWTRVAEHMVEMITAYTGSGVLFAVDTRLRPNGSSGPLVQTESVIKQYFGDAAEAWEGITYMKSRAVAGDPDRAEAFLHSLQETDWRHYGQAAPSRSDLKQMRMRLEKEQGSSHPLKAGRGGYYDIDFLLMYLRLKSAGIYYKVLNTPARIEVLENMGHLDRPTAQFLLEAATFYRALDHGLRIISGYIEGKLPKAEAHREMLTNLLERWTPIPLSDLGEIRNSTRAVFDKHFGA